MSSTISIPATTLHSILARLEQVEMTNTVLKTEIKSLLGMSSAPLIATPAAATAAIAAVKPTVKRGPTRWNRYVSYLTETLTAADPEYKKTPFAERVEQAKLLKDDPEEGMGPTNLAFEAWLAAHPLSPADAAAADGTSSDSGAASDGAKKRGRPKGTKLTEEQKAKAAATRAANKAAKIAAAEEEARVPAAVALAALAAAEEEADLTPFDVNGTTYYRISTGHSWIANGDDMVYVGLYSEATKTFDKSVADPTA